MTYNIVHSCMHVHNPTDKYSCSTLSKKRWKNNAYIPECVYLLPSYNKEILRDCVQTADEDSDASIGEAANLRLILGWTLKGQKARHGRKRRKGGVETVEYTADPVDVLSRSHAPRSTTLSSSTVPAPTGRRQAVVVSKCPKCLWHHSINFHVSEGRYNELIDILRIYTQYT